MMKQDGKYWTIRWESDPPPAPPEAGLWLVVERTLAKWPHLSTSFLYPEPWSDPPTGRAYRWPEQLNAQGVFRALRRRHGAISAVYLHADPRTGKPRASWLVS